MPVVQYRVQEIFAVNGIPSDLLDPRLLSLLEDHSVKELITLFYSDILFHDVIDVIVGIKNFYFDVE